MCNNDDLILNGENMLDHSCSQLRTEDMTHNKNLLESQEDMARNSCSPNVHKYHPRGSEYDSQKFFLEANLKLSQPSKYLCWSYNF